MDNECTFILRAYGWNELALMYNPYVSPKTATKRLLDWVARNEKLHAELVDTGWEKGCRLLTPLQVGVMIKYLGEP